MSVLTKLMLAALCKSNLSILVDDLAGREIEKQKVERWYERRNIIDLFTTQDN